jgi:peroxiredoxin
VPQVVLLAPPLVPPPTLLETVAEIPPLAPVSLTTQPTPAEQIKSLNEQVVQTPSESVVEGVKQEAVHLSPSVSVPALWTTAQEENAAALIRGYTTGSFQLKGYKATSEKDRDDRQRRDLLGKPLPQTRFLSADGGVLDIDALRKQGPVLLIFLRGFSGQVCLYCAAQTTAISNSIARFNKSGIQVVVVYPGPVDAMPAFLAAVRSLANDPPLMPVALDVSLIAVRALQIEDNLAKPTSLYIDSEGKIRYAYQGNTIADRPSVDELLRFGHSLTKGVQ